MKFTDFRTTGEALKSTDNFRTVTHMFFNINSVFDVGSTQSIFL